MVYFLLVIILFVIGFGLYHTTNKIEEKVQEDEDLKRFLEEQEEKEKKFVGTFFSVQVANAIQAAMPDATIMQNCIVGAKDRNGNQIFRNGKPLSRQIDLIVLSKRGIFVIDVGDFRQLEISGDKTDIEWQIKKPFSNKVYKTKSLLKKGTEECFTLKRNLPDYHFKNYTIIPDSTIFAKNSNIASSFDIIKMSEVKPILEGIYHTSNVKTLNHEHIKFVKEYLIEENDRIRNLSMTTELGDTVAEVF